MKIELTIAKEEDRIQVAGILIKNGYRVQQMKRKRTVTAKAYDYLLIAEKAEDEKHAL